MRDAENRKGYRVGNPTHGLADQGPHPAHAPAISYPRLGNQRSARVECVGFGLGYAYLKEHRAKIGIVFLIVFIDLVGFGIVIPILPLYAEEYGPSPVVFGLLMASFSIMQFFAAPILGRLSDRIGRRPVLLVSLLGSALGYVLFGIAGSLAMLFASRIIDGISGGNISTAQAVIADITGPEDRAKGMGIIGAAFGLGFILGPAIGAAPGDGGAVVARYRGRCGIADRVRAGPDPSAGDPRQRRPGARRDAIPSTWAASQTALSHPLVGLCLLMVFFTIFAFANFETTFAQFAKLRFAYSTSTIAWLFVYAGVLGASSRVVWSAVWRGDSVRSG